METSLLTLNSRTLLFKPCKENALATSHKPKRATLKVFASNGLSDSNGRLVDDNMVVLKKRIHDMKMTEGSLDIDSEPPSHWMEWEKQYCVYGNYESDIVEVMGFLQSKLMKSRPSVALGMAALVALSVPTSFALVFFNLLLLAKGVL